MGKTMADQTAADYRSMRTDGTSDVRDLDDSLWPPDESEPAQPAPVVTLDPSDPFEQVLIEMVRTNRRKRADYATDGDPWSNFRFTSSVLGIEPVDAAVHNVAQKLARLTALRANGRGPQNETVHDTYLDLAVYAVIALAIIKHPSGAVVSEAW